MDAGGFATALMFFYLYRSYSLLEAVGLITVATVECGFDIVAIEAD